MMSNYMQYKYLFAHGLYGGRWNINFNIKPGDRVLDIGAGSRPFPPTTDIVDFNSEEAESQRGKGLKVKTGDGLQVHYGKAEDVLQKFDNDEFDFIYTAHTLEHMDDLEWALKEMSRIGKRGFNIIPHYYIDLWWNFPTSYHKWFFSYDHKNNILKYRKREEWEFIEELANYNKDHWRSTLLQSHNDANDIRCLWEIRFYWENGITYEYDDTIYEESKYRKLGKMNYGEIIGL